MVLTPSSTSSAIAGASFWSLMWLTLLKVDGIPFISKVISKDKVLRWVNRNKATTILLTELTNFGLHGVENPNAVTMAVGGSVVNGVVVFVMNPLAQYASNRKNHNKILQGV